jgi:predicted Zn-dependent protease
MNSASEAEADAIGLQLLARACYDPEANVRMLQRLSSHERAAGGPAAQVPGLLRTHPLTESRVARVRAALPEAYKVYGRHCAPLRDGFGEALRSFIG